MKRNYKKILSILLIFTLLFSMMPTNILANSSVEEGRVLKISDPDATQFTKELFAYLQDVSDDEVLFGQQHATDEGLTIKPEDGDVNFVGSTQSEVKNAVGDYPAVFGWDTNSLDGRERPGNAIDDVPLSQEERTQNLAESMITAHELGGIVTLSMHPDNFVTGNYYGDTDGNVVQAILPGGTHHDDYNEWLDNIVDLSHLVKDEDGNHIPIIFRPFHEQTGSWFWWGASTTTPEQYKAIFRYTVEYLREHSANNFLIGYSPGAGPAGDVERYFETYPGDDYVDILGIDNYDNKSNAGSQAWLDAVAEDLAMLAIEAEARGKISAFTEFGYSATGMNEEGNNLSWWEDLLDAIMNHPDYPEAANTSYMLTWANFGFPNNMYVPYRDIHGELGGDHELLETFQAFHDDEKSLFTEQVKGNVYNTGENFVVAEHESVAYTLSPTNGDAITDNTVTIRTRVVNDDDAKVTYSVEGSEEVEMNFDGQYYTADWTPSAALNGGTADITVRYYDGSDNLVSEEVIRTYLRVSEILVDEIIFDEDTEGALNKGTWPVDGVDFELSHAELGEDGKLALSVSGMPSDEWWQELKIGFEDLSHIDFELVNQVKLDVLIPESAGDGALVSTVLAADGETKYGEGSTEQNVSDLETLEVDGAEYKLYEATINLEDTITAGTEFGLIGKQLDFTDTFYLDNIQFVNAYVEAPADPLLVDDFEGYLGDNDLLNRNYSSNGDPITLSLTPDHKNSGEYGLRYDWTIGSQGYSGRQTSLGPVDWSGTNAFQFWLKHDEYPGNHLTVQIQLGGVSFETEIDLEESFEGLVTIPFADFAPAHWEGNQDAIIDTPRLERVSQFALYMGGERGNGTLYFDDLKAVYDEGAPAVPERENVGEVEAIIYNFESDREGWGGNASSIVDGHLVHPIGLGDGAKTEVNKVSGYDLSGHNYIVATVKHDEEGTFGDDPLNAKLFIKTGSGWTWADSGDVSLSSDEYTEIVFDISDNAARENVQEIGLEFTAPEGSEGTTNAYIDSIEILTTLDGVPEIESRYITFETEEDLEGWQPEGIYVEDGSVFIPVDGETMFQNQTGDDFSDYATITARLKVEGTDSLIAKQFIQTGEGWNWADGGEVTIEADEFTEITFDISHISDRDNVGGFGIQFFGNGTAIVEHFVLEPAEEEDIDDSRREDPDYDNREFEDVVAEFTFDNDMEGFFIKEEDNRWQAEFGDPKIEHSTEVGNGALRVNAVIDEMYSWQELKMSVELDFLSDVTMVTYDMFLELDLLEGQGGRPINPHIALDPGWVKYGDGENVRRVNDYPIVTFNDKDYIRITTTNYILGDASGQNILNINFVADNLHYVGPIYIDNVIFQDTELVGDWPDPDLLPVKQETINTDDFVLDNVNLIDPNATPETRSLYAYLQNISNNHILFGHQHATTQGVTFSGSDGTQSDVYNSVGEFPAVYGWDTLSIDGQEEPNGIYETAEVMKLAYDRGGIITLSAHMNNFYTGGDFYDTTSAAEHILPGGSHNDVYTDWLDNLAYFANDLLVDENGNNIPVIFRPFHEHNGGWFWWGTPHNTSEEDFIALWQYTVEYLRDEKGVNSFLYAYSPNGYFDGDEDAYFFGYPGDEYVDILAFDQYDRDLTEESMDRLVADAAMVVRLANERNKLAALTEVGAMYENSGLWPDGHENENKNKTWWTDLGNKLQEDEDARQLAYMMTWRNGALNHMWVPYRNHFLLGNSEMLENFIEFYNDDYTVFGERLGNVYNLFAKTDVEVPIDSPQELIDIISDLIDRIEELENSTEVADLEEIVSELEGELEDLKAKYDALEEKVDGLEQLINNLENQVNELKEGISTESVDDSSSSESIGSSEEVVEPDSKEDSKEEAKDGEQLADTATNMFNYLLVGMLLLLIGGTVFFKARKKVTE